MRRPWISLMVMTAVVALGCSKMTTLPPILVGRAVDAPSDAVVNRLVEAARARGYEADVVQPGRGDFSVRARYADALGGYRFKVECFQDGHVLITPVGPQVQRRRAFYILPRGLRTELLDLARALEDAARSGPRPSA